MFRNLAKSQSKGVSKIISVVVALSFLLTSISGYAQALAPSMPMSGMPGALLVPGVQFNPVMLRAIEIDPVDPFHFGFIVDSGDTQMEGEELTEEAKKLIRYFLASLTTPEEDMWVNLSPYEADRIIPDSFGQTQMGRDLLAQDYILKQLTASLIYPEDELGQQFWQRIYQKAYEQYGTTEIPVDTFNKVWIMPKKASVYEHNNRVFVIDSELDVMMESDFLAMQENRSSSLIADSKTNEPRAKSQELASAILRDIIIPEIKKEVNVGQHFANLRQIYHAMILAAWYKNNLKESLLGQMYVDQNKVKGIEGQRIIGTKTDPSDPQILKSSDPESDVQIIYNQYLETFKQGVYNFIKVEHDQYSGKNLPRKYFSGGFIPKIGGETNLQTGVDQAPVSSAIKTISAIGPVTRFDIKTRPADPSDSATTSASAIKVDKALDILDKLVGANGLPVAARLLENIRYIAVRPAAYQNLISVDAENFDDVSSMIKKLREEIANLQLENKSLDYFWISYQKPDSDSGSNIQTNGELYEVVDLQHSFNDQEQKDIHKALKAMKFKQGKIKSTSASAITAVEVTSQMSAQEVFGKLFSVVGGLREITRVHFVDEAGKIKEHTKDQLVHVAPSFSGLSFPRGNKWAMRLFTSDNGLLMAEHGPDGLRVTGDSKFKTAITVDGQKVSSGISVSEIDRFLGKRFFITKKMMDRILTAVDPDGVTSRRVVENIGGELTYESYTIRNLRHFRSDVWVHHDDEGATTYVDPQTLHLVVKDGEAYTTYVLNEDNFVQLIFSLDVNDKALKNSLLRRMRSVIVRDDTQVTAASSTLRTAGDVVAFAVKEYGMFLQHTSGHFEGKEQNTPYRNTDEKILWPQGEWPEYIFLGDNEANGLGLRLNDEKTAYTGVQLGSYGTWKDNFKDISISVDLGTTIKQQLSDFLKDAFAKGIRSPEAMNAQKFEEKDRPGDEITIAPLLWLEDYLDQVDPRKSFDDIASGKVAYYKFAAGQASRLWDSFVKAGIVSEAEAKDPNVKAKYRMWNLDIWDIANTVRKNIPALNNLKKTWEEELVLAQATNNMEMEKKAKDEIDDLTTIIDGFSYPNAIPGLDLSLSNPQYEQKEIKLGVRHLMALRDGIIKDAIRYSKDPSEVLGKVQLLLSVTNELAPDVIEDLKKLSKDGNLGFLIENVRLIVNDSIPGYRLEDDQLIEVDFGPVENPNPNHGYNVIYAHSPQQQNGIFVYEKNKGDFVRKQESAFKTLKEKGVESIVIQRTNDMIMLVPEGAIDLTAYGLFKALREEKGIDQFVEVLNNFTGEKGGLAVSTKKRLEQGLMFLAEGLAVKTDKAKRILERVREEYQSVGIEDLPYNRMYHFIDLEALNSLLEANDGILPMSVKNNKPKVGVWSPEIPTGDLTMLPGMKTAALIRRHDALIDREVLPQTKNYPKGSGAGALIHDFKQLKHLLVALGPVNLMDQEQKALKVVRSLIVQGVNVQNVIGKFKGGDSVPFISWNEKPGIPMSIFGFNTAEGFVYDWTGKGYQRVVVDQDYDEPLDSTEIERREISSSLRQVTLEDLGLEHFVGTDQAMANAIIKSVDELVDTQDVTKEEIRIVFDDRSFVHVVNNGIEWLEVDLAQTTSLGPQRVTLEDLGLENFRGTDQAMESAIIKSIDEPVKEIKNNPWGISIIFDDGRYVAVARAGDRHWVDAPEDSSNLSSSFSEKEYPVKSTMLTVEQLVDEVATSIVYQHVDQKPIQVSFKWKGRLYGAWDIESEDWVSQSISQGDHIVLEVRREGHDVQTISFVQEQDVLRVQVPAEFEHSIFSAVSGLVERVTASSVGGIIMSSERLDMQIRRDGNGIPLPLLQQPVELMNVPGFTFDIIGVTVVPNLLLLSGLADDQDAIGASSGNTEDLQAKMPESLDLGLPQKRFL